MKSRKIVSFLLMIAILVSMNITLGFAEDSTEDKHILETLYNEEGGTVSGAGEYTRNVPRCEEAEHDHNNDNCNLELTCELHTHGDQCYAECTIEPHTHGSTCCGNEPTCGRKEHNCTFLKCTRITCEKEYHDHIGCPIGRVCRKKQHGTILGTHDDSCYGKLICNKFHIHTKIGGCYELKCNEEVHIHIDVFGGCLGFTCGQEFHIHDLCCHTFGNCGEEHDHDQDCYLACEQEVHEHSEKCRPLTCEVNEHTDADHTDDCYSCTINPHTHGSGCYDWPNADVVAEAFDGWYITSVKIKGNDQEKQEIVNSRNFTKYLYMDQDYIVEVVFEELPDRLLTVEFNQSDSIPGVTNAWIISNPSEEDIEFNWSIFHSEQSGSKLLEAGKSVTIYTNAESDEDTIEISWVNELRDEGHAYATAKMYTFIIDEGTINGSITDNFGRTLSSENTYYFAGSTVILTANPATGYRIKNWNIRPQDDDVQVTIDGLTATIKISDFSSDELETNPEFNYPSWVDGIYVTAEFETVPSPSPAPVTYYTLNVEVEGPGSVTPASGSFTAGNRVVLLPTANEGARFVGWYGENGSEVDANNGIIMNGNKNLIARFELIAAEEAEEETENVEEFTDETVPESGNINDGEEEVVVVTEQEVTDQEVPYDGPALPQTGGIPMEVLMGAGLTLVTAGCSLLKKKKEDEE